MSKNEKPYKSADNKIKYNKRTDRESKDDLNRGRVFLTDEEQNKMIPYLHEKDYPERQMRKLSNNRNAIISCDYDNSIIVWKNDQKETPVSNPTTVTAIAFNASGEQSDEPLKQHECTMYEENTKWDPERIIDRDDETDKHDNKQLDQTRKIGRNAMEIEFPTLRRFIQVDIYAKPSRHSSDLKDETVTNMKTILSAINISQGILLDWGCHVDKKNKKRIIPDWNDIEHNELEATLKKLANEKKVYWLGQGNYGQPIHPIDPSKPKKLELIDSNVIDNIFNMKETKK